MQRGAFFALSALGVAAGAPASAQATPLAAGIIPAEICGQVLYGIDEGYFSRAGLTVQPQFFSNGGAIAAAIASGALDVGMVDMTSLISAHARGIPFVVLAAALVNSVAAPTFGIVVRGDSPIQTARDFAGKTIAVNGLNNVAQIAAEAWIDNNGGDPKAVKFIELPLPAKAPAVKAGTVDGSLDTEPFLTYGTDQGFRAFLMEQRPLAPAYLLNVYATTRAWAERNAASAASFVSAVRAASAWANRNHDASGPILAKYTKLPVALIARMHRGDFATANDPKLVQPVIDAAVKYGLIDRPFPAAELFYGS
jgi:NitT/TauT family transport system substrate-binding protein